MTSQLALVRLAASGQHQQEDPAPDSHMELATDVVDTSFFTSETKVVIGFMCVHKKRIVRRDLETGSQFAWLTVACALCLLWPVQQVMIASAAES
jgi:hypothetical protein